MVHKLTMTRKEAGYLEGFVSIIVNTVLGLVKLYVGLISNSIAVIADAFHTLSDSLTSVILVVGCKVGFKPADEEHPFGHQRFENIVAIIIGTLLGVIGFQLAMDSISRLISRETFIFMWSTVVVLAISVVVKEALTRWALNLARKFNMKSIEADAWHHRSDAIASLLVLIGFLVGGYLWWIDGVLGLVVSGLIVYVAFVIIKETSNKIMGRAPSRSEEEAIKQIASEVSELIKDVHHIHIHEYGDHVEVTLHIRVPPELNIEKAHQLASLLENKIREKLKWEATIHVEPYKK